MEQKKKILIITPRFPFNEGGACEQDRAAGVKDFVRYGYEVVVITKSLEHELAQASDFGEKIGAKIIPILYKDAKKLPFAKRVLFYFKRIINPIYWDGAAYEYKDMEIQNAVKDQLKNFKPDVVWFDYTYLWPLYDLVRRKGIPIVTRSINFEPVHFLQEDGYSFANLLKFLPKLLSEIFAVRKSDMIFSISPNELKTYKKMGAKNAENLPLRGLPYYLGRSALVADDGKMDFYFAGSTYNVHHNWKTLEFILLKLIPRLKEKLGENFVFNILGAKMPKKFEKYLNGQVIYRGYVHKSDEKFWGEPHVAVIPSLMGAGMQQKIFEPMARGVPAVISPRGLAGYPFEHGKDVLLCDSVDEFVENILKLKDIGLRRQLSEHSVATSRKIFSQEIIDSLVKNGIATAEKTVAEKQKNNI